MNQRITQNSARESAPKTGIFSSELLDFAYPKLEQAHAIIAYIEALLTNDSVSTADQHHGVEAAIGIANRLARDVADNHEYHAGVGTINNPDFDWVSEDLYPAIGLMTIMECSLWEGEAKFIVDQIVVLNLIQQIGGAFKKVLDLLASPPAEPTALSETALRDVPQLPSTAQPRDRRVKAPLAAALHAVAN